MMGFDEPLAAIGMVLQLQPYKVVGLPPKKFQPVMITNERKTNSNSNTKSRYDSKSNPNREKGGVGAAY